MKNLSVAVGNIKANPRMTDGQVRQDIVRLAALGADVTVGAEIDYPYSRKTWVGVFRRGNRKTYNISCECPISTDLPVRWSWITRLHGGVAKVTPARFNSGLRLKGSPAVLVIGKHPVSGAFRTRFTTAQKLRQRLFGTDLAATQRRIERAVKHGVSVVVAGDLNTIKAPAYHPDQIVAAHAGLIWVIVVPAPQVNVRVGATQVVGARVLHTDHPFVEVGLRFLKGAVS